MKLTEEIYYNSPIGTVIRFHGESVVYRCEANGFWARFYGEEGRGVLGEFDTFKDWDFEYETSFRSAKQNAKIVENIENLLESAMESIKRGDTPGPTTNDINWLTMIIDCVENGEKA